MSNAMVWLVVLGAFAGAFGWMFRRVVVLFAALEAVERIEDNAPPPRSSRHESLIGTGA